jgi:hypothetical protein
MINYKLVTNTTELSKTTFAKNCKKKTGINVDFQAQNALKLTYVHPLVKNCQSLTGFLKYGRRDGEIALLTQASPIPAP